MQKRLIIAIGGIMSKQRNLGRTKSVGVGLREREIEEIDELAEELGFSRNAIMVWMIRHLMRKIREGDLEIPIETKTEVTKYIGDP